MAPAALLTGAGGLIGRQAVRALSSRGHRTICLSRSPIPGVHGAQCHAFDIHDPGSCEQVVGAANADVLLHLAWDVSPGYWQSSQNVRWLESSLRLARVFIEAGGRRIVLAGTCAEYDWAASHTAAPLNERTSPLRPRTLYAKCKRAMYETVAALGAEPDVSVAEGLLFFPFGIGEGRHRLLPQVITALLAGRAARTTSGRQIRDFIDVRDAGAAIAALATSDVTGRVNIGTGEGISVADFTELARRACGPDGEIVRDLPDRRDDPPKLVADIGRLRDEVGFIPQHSVEDGIRDAVAWWRKHG